METNNISINETIELFLENIRLSRSENTEKTYRNAMKAFLEMLTEKGYDPDKYLRIYENADGDSSQDKINAIRRDMYQQNKDKINAQKREAYARRKEAGLL